MDTVPPAPTARSAAATPVLARPLSQDESAHLDRLRDWLRRDGTDASDSAALDARWARLLETHPPEVPAPAGVAAAIGIAVGDLLVASVRGALWMMCPGPEGATPGVLLPERANMPVLPVLDAHARWRRRAPQWTVDYVERASVHLRSLLPQVPRPHRAPETAAGTAPATDPAVTSETPAEPAAATVGATPAADAADATPAAWSPTSATTPDETAVDAAPADAAAPAWTPTVVEDVEEPPAHDTATTDPDTPVTGTWTPTFVEDVESAPDADASAAEAWTPTFVEDDTAGVATEPTATDDAPAWTPTLVPDDAPDELWTPTSVTDDAAGDDAPASDGSWVPVVVTDLPADDVPGDVEEPHAWTPTIVEGGGAEEPAQGAAWTPTFVESVDGTPSTDDALPVVDDRAAVIDPLTVPIEALIDPLDPLTAPIEALTADLGTIDPDTVDLGTADVTDADLADADLTDADLADAGVAPVADPAAVAEDESEPDHHGSVDAPATDPADVLVVADPVTPDPADAQPAEVPPAADPSDVLVADTAVTDLVDVPVITDLDDVPAVTDLDDALTAPPAPAAAGPTVSTPTPVVVEAYPTPGRGLPVTGERPLTPEDLPYPPTERVQDLALRALELGLDRAVGDPAGSAPFLLIREGYDVEVVEFEHSDAGIAQAREAARAGGYSAAAVAWTSPADATRPFPRVVVDASAAGRPGLRVAHAFTYDEDGGREIGGPQVVGQSAPVL